jgi:hypothetical protein
VEFGEDLLAAFYKFRDVIAAVRSPSAFGEEGAGRPRDDGEDSSIARNKDTYYVPLERLHNIAISLPTFSASVTEPARYFVTMSSNEHFNFQTKRSLPFEFQPEC